MQERITPRSADNASAGPSLPEATDGLQFEAITGPAAKREQAAMLADQLARIAELETRQAALAAEQVQLTAEFLAGRERFEAAWHPGFGRQAARIIAAEMATAK